MDGALSLVVLGGVAIAALLGYWAIVVTEGAYFGRRLVSYLYDRGAATYDNVKEFDPAEDARFLGVPMARNLEGIGRPLVLDVATGTGRMALSLLRQLSFAGHVVGLDQSEKMLAIAQRKAQRYTGRATWVRKDATRLPFADESFDAVACVEALEFLPAPLAALAEMVRVLRPGGSLLVTNRIGWEHFLMPRRSFNPQRLESMLVELGLGEVVTKPWQTYYDLIWARKPGPPTGRPTPPALADVLCCPTCGHRLADGRDSRLRCAGCQREFGWQQGILDLESGPGRDRRWQRVSA